MSYLTKTLLLVGSLGMVAGLAIDFGCTMVASILTAILPFGAVFLALGIICMLLDGVVAEYELEEAGKQPCETGSSSKANSTILVFAPQGK